MKRVVLSRTTKFWDRLKLERRSKYNRFFNRREFKIEEVQEFSSPREISLDRALKFISRGVDGDYVLVFKEDVSDAEIKKILELAEELL